MNVSQRELLCLALDAVPGSLDRPPVPWRHSLTGLTDALTSDGVPRELDILLALEEMESDGLVEQATRPVDGIDEDRRVFELTDAGRERALKLRQALVDEPVTVRHDGEFVEISLGEVGEYLDSGVPIVRALVDAGPDGVVDADRYRPGERFVGRDRVISLFETDVWCTGDDPTGLLLRGPSGVGKVAITAECARSIRSNGNTVLIGETPEAGGASYAPFRSIFQELGDESTPFETITPSNEEMDSEDYQSMRLSLFYDLYEQLRGYALETGPTLLVVRDLQWASSATLDLLSFLLTRLDEAPVSVLGTVNTEHQDGKTSVFDQLGDEQRPVTEELFMPIDVQPLDRWEFEPLVQWHLRAEDVPETFLDVLHEHTGGNPEYVASVLEHLQETGQIDLSTGTYPTSADELSVPDTTRSVIEARTERLDDVHREVLEAAAVVGERASLAVLTGMVDPSESALRPIAEDLVQNALWERSDQVTAILSRTYEFRTPLARQVVLDALDAEERTQLHRAAAEAVLETTLSADRLKEAVAACHFENAGQPDRALEWYRNAGKRANKLYNYDEAVEYYERALELADDADREEAALDVLEALSYVQYHKGDIDGADESLDRLLDRTDDPERIQRVQRMRCNRTKKRGHFEQAEAHARTGIAVTDEPTELTSRFWGILGIIELNRGNTEQAAEYFDHQSTLVDQLDDTGSRGTLAYNRALLARGRGNLEKTIEHAEEARLYFRRSGAALDVVSSQELLGVAHYERNDITKALRAYDAARERNEEIGNRVFELSLDLNCANCAFVRGDWSTALEQYETIADVARTLGQQLLLARSLINCSLVHCYRGQLDAARACAEESLTISESTGDVSITAPAEVELATICLFEDDLETARRRAKSGLEQASTVVPHYEAKAACRLGDIELAAENAERATEHYEHARERAAACESTRWCAYAMAGQAATRLEANQTEAALDRAKRACDELASGYYADVQVRVHLVLARCLQATGKRDEATEAVETALGIGRDVEATVLESYALFERGRLNREETPDRAAEDLEAALVLATGADAALFERQCRATLDGLGTDEQVTSPRE
jgi:tetratricopeptide (TPR) repeat protein